MKEDIHLKMIEAVTNRDYNYFYKLDSNLNYIVCIEDTMSKIEKLYTILKDKKEYMVNLNMKGIKYDMDNYYPKLCNYHKKIIRLPEELSILCQTLKNVLNNLEISLHQLKIQD